ncbi:acyltransferase [Aquabacterium sp. OR-4]|uniref:acyltransferase n=1 Tax=Aquabacterium sp. OR-4 TaxID=2978127 RepID=UPI0028C8D086|nr:acyltransferase [Aquabacterium sp. OR-4]MDT7833981.1 acyltransferase [Aquabacterium sp. OR-4]
MRDRVVSIDSVKGMALIAVVAIHTEPFHRSRPASASWQLAGHVIQQCASFAVPFFFLAAGFLLSERMGSHAPGAVWQRYVRRLALLLGAWTLVNGCFQGNWLFHVWQAGSVKPLLWNALAIPSFAVHRPDLFLFRTSATPLWFLVSLIWAVSVLALLVRLGLARAWMAAIAALSYLAALAMGAYAVPIGSATTAQLLEHRGPFIATAFVLAGHALARSPPRRMGAVAALGLPLALMFVETTLLSALHGEAFRERPYLLATLPLSVAVLAVARQRPNFGAGTPLPALGRMSMGIYLMHIPVIGALTPARLAVDSAAWELGFVAWVMVISGVLVRGALKAPVLRRFVV